MRDTTKRLLLATLAVALVAGLCTAVAAEDEADTGWHDTAELSAVFTSGNSENTTIGFKNRLWREWDRSMFTLKLGGIKAESTTFTRTAIGTPDNIIETETEETTAESYYLNGRFDRKISDSFFWYTGLGWDRNELAGIENRYIAEAGVGNVWVDTEDVKFSTAYALTFTKQEDVVELPGADDTFAGARLSYIYLNKLTDSTTYGNDLVLDFNFDESDDWRADWVHSLAVTMSKRLALKLGLQLLYDNMPSFELLTIQMPTDPNVTTVPFELDDLDTIFTASVVFDF